MPHQANDRPGIWAEISRAVLIANLLITVVAVGTHAAIMKLLGADELLQFTQVLGRTAPLAIAVAAITWLTLWQCAADEFNFGLWLLAGAVALYVATWCANQFGDLRVTGPLRSPGADSNWGLTSAGNYSIRMLLTYYTAYGERDFWSSITVGGALGWIWHRLQERTKVLPHRAPAIDALAESNRKAA